MIVFDHFVSENEGSRVEDQRKKKRDLLKSILVELKICLLFSGTKTSKSCSFIAKYHFVCVSESNDSYISHPTTKSCAHCFTYSESVPCLHSLDGQIFCNIFLVLFVEFIAGSAVSRNFWVVAVFPFLYLNSSNPICQLLPSC